MSLGSGTLSHGFTFEVDLVRAVHQAIQNGVGERRVADIVVPVVDGKLTGDQRGASADTVIKELEQIRALARPQGRARRTLHAAPPG